MGGRLQLLDPFGGRGTSQHRMGAAEWPSYPAVAPYQWAVCTAQDHPRPAPPVARKASKKCKGGSGVKGTQICSSVLGIYVHSAYFSRERKPRTHNVSYIQKDFQNSRKIELKPICYAAPEFFKSMHAMGFQKAHENMYDKKAWISTNFLEHPCV